MGTLETTERGFSVKLENGTRTFHFIGVYSIEHMKEIVIALTNAYNDGWHDAMYARYIADYGE